MDFKKFLTMMSEAESTSEKDAKAEKAGKEVAKDIEHDEGHKGKDDDKAEKAGEKVTKDIEYDDKKDKKSLKDWFEIIDKNMLAEAEQITVEPAKQNTQVIRQGTKTIGTVTNPQLAAQIKQSIGKGEMNLAGHEIKEDDVEESGLQAYFGKKKYGKEGMAALQKAGRAGASKEKMAQIRAKHDKLDEIQVAEKAKNPYAIGMAQAMKSKGDKPPLKKSTIVKAHDIAKAIKKTDEAEIPKSGPDYGAGLGAGRSQSTFEGLENFSKSDRKWMKDLEKQFKPVKTPKNTYIVVQGNVDSDEGFDIPVYYVEYNGEKVYGPHYRIDRIRKFAKQKEAEGHKVMYETYISKDKKKVDEAMNTLEAAYHEGKSHGLTKHGYACRYNEGTDEHRRYHEGFKEGLDECYGLMPNRGLVVSEADPIPSTVPGMADQAMEAEMDEGNAFTAALAKTPKGEKFSVGGKTFTDRSDYNAKIDEFAFESLSKQLDELLNEGLSVNMSQGLNDAMGGQGSDSVSVTATDDDAAKLLDFIKQVGLGGLGGEKALDGQAEPVAVSSDYGAPKFSGHDDMVGLMKVATDDYKDEEGHDHNDKPKMKMCGVHKLPEGECGCGEGKEIVDEVESEDQMEYQVAEDDGEGYEQSQAAAAEIDSALAGAQGNKDVEVAEGGDGSEASEEPEMTEAAEDNPVTPEEELTEWANDAGKDGTEQAFERDIEFMTKVISGGLNKPKSTGQTTIPVIAGQEARIGEEDAGAWKKLVGIFK
jgi:hypothetical protein